MSSKEYSILNWITILLENRIVNLSTPIQKRAKEYLIENYMINYKDYDLIYGYRADDSYFMYARSFISNEISLNQLELAMKLGNLGYQYCLKSKIAFDNLKFNDAEIITNNIYYPKKQNRDQKAKNDFFKELENDDLNGIFIKDIIQRKL